MPMSSRHSVAPWPKATSGTIYSVSLQCYSLVTDLQCMIDLREASTGSLNEKNMTKL